MVDDPSRAGQTGEAAGAAAVGTRNVKKVVIVERHSGLEYSSDRVALEEDLRGSRLSITGAAPGPARSSLAVYEPSRKSEVWCDEGATFPAQAGRGAATAGSCTDRCSRDCTAIPGPHAMCLAYRQSAWSLLSNGTRNVGEDRWDQWYGTRAGMWVRLQHKETGQGVIFVNHHGPLPVDTGGMCGGEATAFNLLKLIASSAQADDVIILVGDFNAGPQAQTLRSLQNRMHPLHTGKSFGGVDNVFSSCPNVVGKRNLGSGGSDHDALETVLQL